MTEPRATDVTRLLLAWCDGDAGALAQLHPLVSAVPGTSRSNVVRASIAPRSR